MSSASTSDSSCGRVYERTTVLSSRSGSATSIVCSAADGAAPPAGLQSELPRAKSNGITRFSCYGSIWLQADITYLSAVAAAQILNKYAGITHGYRSVISGNGAPLQPGCPCPCLPTVFTPNRSFRYRRDVCSSTSSASLAAPLRLEARSPSTAVEARDVSR